MTNHENLPTNPSNEDSRDWMDEANVESLETMQQLLREARARELIYQIEEDTEFSSVIIDIIEHPHFAELLQYGEDALRAILNDSENFSHTHSVTTQKIAESMGSPIHFSEEAMTSFRLVKEEIIRWLTERYQESANLPESN